MPRSTANKGERVTEKQPLADITERSLDPLPALGFEEEYAEYASTGDAYPRPKGMGELPITPRPLEQAALFRQGEVRTDHLRSVKVPNQFKAEGESGIATLTIPRRN